MIEDIHTLVKGGVVESSTGLAAIRNPETYRRWGASLKYNPTLIEYEVKRRKNLPHCVVHRLSTSWLFPLMTLQTMPIYELVRFSTAAGHAGPRQANLQRAWDEYMQQFDPCRCAPCRHNGIPFFSGTSCKCVCKEGYRGEACEETLRSGESASFHQRQELFSMLPSHPFWVFFCQIFCLTKSCISKLSKTKQVFFF